MVKDPVCGMSVDEADAMHAERSGKIFFFCSEHCRTTFLNQSSSTTGKDDARAERSANDLGHRHQDYTGTRERLGVFAQHDLFHFYFVSELIIQGQATMDRTRWWSRSMSRRESALRPRWAAR